MSVNHDSSPHLSSAEEGDIVGYSAISPAAVLALLLGLASYFAVGNLLLLVLPALAIMTALWSLSAIARSEGSLSGRWVAIAGLTLALLFSSTAIVRSATRTWKLRSDARAVADAWLKLVRRGKLHEAHQWHLTPERRQLAGTLLAQHYQNDSTAREDFQQFTSAAPLSQVIDAPHDATEQFERVVEQLSAGDGDRVALLYTLRTDDDAQPPLEFVIVAQRQVDKKTRVGEWYIAAIAPPQEPTP